MSEQEPQYVAETLGWCNDRRVEKGMEPLDRLPKGQRGNGSSCPCGKATGVHVGALTWGADYNDYVERNRSARLARTYGGEDRTLPLPEPVRSFVSAFDAGHLPQYDIQAEEEGETSAE